MAASIWDGPLHSYGDMGTITAAVGGTGGAVPDPNLDAGPCMLYQGDALPDVRFLYLKDKVQGYTGVVPAMLHSGFYILTSQIPAAHLTTGIAAAQNTVAGAAMTLATAQGVGFAPGVPLIPLSAALNTGAAVTVLALDFGFAFGNCTAGSATIPVADSTMFEVGMPLVIAGVGNSAGTTALLTQVASIPSATSITVPTTAVPLASNATAPIGTGNLWGPSEVGFPLPTAALPYVAQGPGLFLDQQQTISRNLVVTCNSVSGTGGNITVVGYDVYGARLTEKIAIVPGTSVSGFGKKAFKYIVSATPDFTDAGFTYALGTADSFGFAFRSDNVELTSIWWNGALNVAATGYTAAVATSPATNLTGDVRGTIQTSSVGSGSGIGGTASNGSIVGLAMSGVRLMIGVNLSDAQQTYATPANPVSLYGVTQA